MKNQFLKTAMVVGASFLGQEVSAQRPIQVVGHKQYAVPQPVRLRPMSYVSGTIDNLDKAVDAEVKLLNSYYRSIHDSVHTGRAGYENLAAQSDQIKGTVLSNSVKMDDQVWTGFKVSFDDNVNKVAFIKQAGEQLYRDGGGKYPRPMEATLPDGRTFIVLVYDKKGDGARDVIAAGAPIQGMKIQDGDVEESGRAHATAEELGLDLKNLKIGPIDEGTGYANVACALKSLLMEMNAHKKSEGKKQDADKDLEAFLKDQGNGQEISRQDCGKLAVQFIEKEGARHPGGYRAGAITDRSGRKEIVFYKEYKRFTQVRIPSAEEWKQVEVEVPGGYGR